MSSIINRSQIVYLKFNAGNASVTQGYVSCPYPVKEILVKNIVCNSTDTTIATTYPDKCIWIDFFRYSF